MKNKLIFLGAILLTFSIGCSKEEIKTEKTKFSILKGNINKFVEAKGEIKAEKTTNIITPNGVWGASLESMVPEGTIVKKGDFIAKLNVRRFIENNSHLLEDLVYAEVDFEKRKIEMPIEIIDLRMNQKEKENNLLRKELDLKKISDGPEIDELIKNKTEIEISELKINNFPIEKKKKLYNKGFISKQEYDLNNNEYEGLISDYKTSKITKDQLDLNYFSEEIKKSKLLKNKAQLDYKINNLQNSAKKASLEAKVKNSEFKVKRYNRRYNLAQKKIKQAIIKSPINGIVIYPKIWGWKKPHVGMDVWSGFSFLKVANINKLIIEAKVNEFDIVNVKLDQEVEVKINGFDNKIFNGRVTKVSKLGKYLDERKQEGLKYFDVRVSLDKEVTELKPNMTAELKINISKYKNVFYVPIEAVKRENNRNYLMFIENNKPVKKYIEIKDKNNDFVILSGKYTGKEKFYF